MSGQEITPAQVSVVLNAMIADFRATYPGIRRDTAIECLLVMGDIMRDCDTASEAEAVFLDRVEEAEDRREPWAIDIRLAINRKRKSTP